MKPELKLFNFYSDKEKTNLNVFQVINKKIPYILWGIKAGRVGSFLLCEEDLKNTEFVEITKEEFLSIMKKEIQDFQHTISLIEETSEQEYLQKRKEYEKYLEENITPFEGKRILLNPDNIVGEMGKNIISRICEGASENDREAVTAIFNSFQKSSDKRIEQTIELSNGEKYNLLFRQ
jgi:hypothetical protein